jgi:hypothetical protein
VLRYWEHEAPEVVTASIAAWLSEEPLL